MRPHPKLRKTIKWGGAVVTVLLIGVWIGSGFCSVRHLSTVGAISLRHGCVNVWGTRGVLASALGTEFDPPSPRDPFALQWWCSLRTSHSGPVLSIPLWWFVLASALLTVQAWRRAAARGRAWSRAHHRCASCGYDRTGLAVGAKCPECGAALPDAAS